jgi:ubiquinone/menaquinone biosynthesis C-methylase UbiE
MRQEEGVPMENSDEKLRELSRQFFEQELEQYGDVVPPSGQDDQHLHTLLRNLVVARKAFALLDIGCGIGYVARAVKAARPEAEVFGVDISPSIIVKAKELDREHSVLFDVANELDFPYANGSFDFAICRFSIHHYPQALSHFREVHRVLRTNGTYLVIDVVPDSGRYDEWLNQVFALVGREDGHVKFYTLNEYNLLLCQTGFLLDSVESFPLLLDFPKDHMLFQPIKTMSSEFQEMVLFREYKRRFSFQLKAAGIYARSEKTTTTTSSK